MKTKRSLLFLFFLIATIFFVAASGRFLKQILFPVCAPVSPSITNCSPGNESSTLEITAKEAIQIGFPLYLPSPEATRSMGISIPEHISFMYYNSTCSYLKIPIHFNGKKASGITMQVSNGCAYPLPTAMYTDEFSLSWARGGRAHIIEDSQRLSTIVIKEHHSGFQYLIFSDEPLATTIELLESMQYMN